MMRARSSLLRNRRRMSLTASAAVVCLGTLLAACGSGTSDDGYVAVGAAGDGPSTRVEPVEPTEDVEFVPLDEDGNEKPSSKSSKKNGSSDDDGDGGGSGGNGASGSAGSGSGSGGSEGESSGGSGGSGSASGSSGGSGSSGSSGSTGSSGDTGGSGGSGSGDSGGTSGGSDSGSGTPAGPAVLKIVGEPVRKATDKRWCEKVTVTFQNTGGTAVRSGEVAFGTHIIGGLGIDWATIKSTQALSAPIAAGAKKEQTWTVCVEDWRVPLGMHIETQDVSVKWQ